MAINKITRPYPKPDFDREDRVVGDIADLMHGDTEKSKKLYARWLRFVLDDANDWHAGPWWFLENVYLGTLDTGQDVIDVTGHFDKPISVYAPCKLTYVPLSLIASLRMQAKENDSANAGDVKLYSLEGGRRIHLWPAPAEDGIGLGLIYTRPMEIPIVPSNWEAILVNGVIGLYGRHYDRSGLGERASDFERRYRNGLKRARVMHHDIEVSHPWHEFVAGTSTLSTDPSSADTDTATETLVPASLSGIGYLEIETGDYKFEVS